MPFGIGAGGAVGFGFESVMGTYVAPTIWIPILDETLKYTENKYYSQQLRQQATDSDVQPSFYHAEGDIRLEVDVNYLPYLFYCSRHTITKSGAGPFTYKFVPSTAGSTSTAGSGAVQRTGSITVLRNGIFFGYTGSTLAGYEFTIEDGVLLATLNVLGLGEVDGSGTPAWIAPSLFGAASHKVYVDASGVAPAFAAASDDFNGYTFRANHNAEPQNRIRSERSATYVKFGKTDFELESELDFLDKTEYNNFKNAAVKAFKMESLKGGATFATATEAVKLQQNRVAYDAYDVNLPGIGDIIMAGFTGHGLNITGGDSYAVEIKSPVSIA